MWLVETEIKHELNLVAVIDDTEPIAAEQLDEAKAKARRLAAEIKKFKFYPVLYLLSDYWDGIRHGSPLTFAEIRDGIPIFDPAGFFVPIKKLLLEGRVPGTAEAMRTLIAKAPTRIHRVQRLHKVAVIDEVAAAVIDAAQATLLLIGVAPPIPKHIGAVMKARFVDAGLLEAEYVRYIEEIVSYYKALEHGERKDVPGKDLDELLRKASAIVEKMERLAEALAKQKKSYL